MGRLRGWPARGAPANVDPNETAARIIAAVNTVDGDAAVGAPLGAAAAPRGAVALCVGLRGLNGRCERICMLGDAGTRVCESCS